MGFYAKKTLTGYRKIDGGAADQEADHYIETKEEHEETLQRLRDAQESAHYARESAQREKKRAAKEAERADRAEKQTQRYAMQAEEAAGKEQIIARKEKRISILEERIEELEKQLQSEKYLHRNLQRIMRERANQARGITPKKAHDGYIVLESRQWTERYKEDLWDTEDHRERYDTPERRGAAVKKGYLKIIHKVAETWRSTIQTPYDASLPIGQVKSRIEEEIGSVLEDLNVESRLKGEHGSIEPIIVPTYGNWRFLQQRASGCRRIAGRRSGRQRRERRRRPLPKGDIWTTPVWIRHGIRTCPISSIWISWIERTVL